MTDPTPTDRRSPLEHERDASNIYEEHRRAQDARITSLEAQLAEAQAMVAAAYEAAAQKLQEAADDWRSTGNELPARKIEDEIPEIRDLTPADALAALNRIREDARREGWEAAKRAAAKPLTDAEKIDAALSYRHDLGLLPPSDQADYSEKAHWWHCALSHRIRALAYQKGDSHE